MSGLLRRLAARAMGVAPSVRPVAERHAVPVHPSHSEVAAPARESELEREVLARAASAPAPRSQVVAELPNLQTGIEPCVREREQMAEMAPGSPTRRSPRTTPTAPIEHAALAATSDDFRNAAQPVSPPSVAVHAGGENIAPTAPAADDPQRASFADAPPLLPLPLLARSLPPLMLDPPRSRRATAARAAVEDTAEVHVTIGRIEVTAVHETAPSKRERTRPRKPKSLEEYLSGRQERRT